MNQTTITARQLMILVIFFMIGTTILVVPSSLAAEGKQGAWLLQLGGTGSGLLLLWFYVTILKRNAGQSLFQMNEQLLGRWLGKAVSLTLAAAILIFCAQVLYYIGSFITTQIMPDTPIEAIHILFLAATIFGTKLGITVLARTAEIYFPWVVLLFLFFIFFIVPDFQVKQLLPLREIEGAAVMRGSFAVLSYSYLPLFVTFAAFHANIDWKKESAKAYYLGGLISGGMLVILVLGSTMVLGPQNTEIQVYPTYVMARKINVGSFLQRVEVIVAFLWFICIYFKITLYFNAMVTGVAEVFQIAKREAGTLCVPLGILVIVMSLVVYPNYIYQHRWDTVTWTSEAIILGLVYPSLLLAASVIRSKMGGKRQNEGPKEQT